MMRRFKDRVDAGKQLVSHLERYKNNLDAIVIGLPRGGVPVAFEVAKALGVPLDIVVSRKIGAPGRPELAVGAITEDGSVMLNRELMTMVGVNEEQLRVTIEAEKREAQRRLTLYRGDQPPLDLKDKITILVDDGIATGSTMLAAIVSARAHGAKKVIVAIPVAPADGVQKISKEADEVVCLSTPDFFPGVGYFYDTFGQTEDEEVIALMQK